MRLVYILHILYISTKNIRYSPSCIHGVARHSRSPLTLHSHETCASYERGCIEGARHSALGIYCASNPQTLPATRFRLVDPPTLIIVVLPLRKQPQSSQCPRRRDSFCWLRLVDLVPSVSIWHKTRHLRSADAFYDCLAGSVLD